MLTAPSDRNSHTDKFQVASLPLAILPSPTMHRAVPYLYQTAVDLLAHHWHDGHNENEIARALAGGLRREGWTLDDILVLVERTAVLAGDQLKNRRSQAVREACRCIAEGRVTTGWPRLTRLLNNETVVAELRMQLKQESTSSSHPSIKEDILPSSNPDAIPNAENKKQSDPLFIRCMADVEVEYISWLWEPYIALEKMTIIDGDPGLGKSWLTCALAAALSHGSGLPGAEPFEPCNVLMLSAEDGLGDTLRPRLDLVGADVSRVFALDEPLTLDATGLIRFEKAIKLYSPKLVIIDPLFAFTGGNVDINRANECRAITSQIAAIAARHKCAIVVVRHLGKSRGQGHALNAGIGSIDITAAARSVLLVGADPDDQSRRAIIQIKNNLAPIGPAIGYRLDEGKFTWTGESSLTSGRILSAASSDSERNALDEAVNFFKGALSSGLREVEEVKAEATRVGISSATLRRAREWMGIRAQRVGAVGEKQKFFWALPPADDAHDDAQIPADDVQNDEHEHHRANGTDKAVSYTT